MFDKPLLLAPLLSLLLCTPVLAQDLVGKMGGAELRLNELKSIIDGQSPEVRRQLAADPAQLERLVRAELMRKALLDEAREKGWDKRPEVAVLMERAREQVLAGSYLANLTRPAAEYPLEDEIKQFYEANKSQLAAPVQYQLAQIFIPAADDADKTRGAEAQKKANDLSARLGKPGADFAKLAKEQSAHKESADKGGDLGWLTEEQIIPEIRRSVLKMAKGEVSAPIKSASGWHIVKLLDKRPAGTRPLADIRPNLVAAMRQHKTQELERAYLDAVTKKAPATINQIELNKLQSGIR